MLGPAEERWNTLHSDAMYVDRARFTNVIHEVMSGRHPRPALRSWFEGLVGPEGDGATWTIGKVPPRQRRHYWDAYVPATAEGPEDARLRVRITVEALSFVQRVIPPRPAPAGPPRQALEAAPPEAEPMPVQDGHLALEEDQSDQAAPENAPEPHVDD